MDSFSVQVTIFQECWNRFNFLAVWWCCMFPGPSPWPIGHQFVGWGVIKKKIEIPTTLKPQQALTLSTTFTWKLWHASSAELRGADHTTLLFLSKVHISRNFRSFFRIFLKKSFEFWQILVDYSINRISMNKKEISRVKQESERFSQKIRIDFF